MHLGGGKGAQVIPVQTFKSALSNVTSLRDRLLLPLPSLFFFDFFFFFTFRDSFSEISSSSSKV